MVSDWSIEFPPNFVRYVWIIDDNWFGSPLNKDANGLGLILFEFCVVTFEEVDDWSKE